MKAYKKHITYAITGLEDLYGVYIKKYSVAGLFDPGRPATVTRAKRVWREILKHFIAKNILQIGHIIAYLANYLHRKLQVWRKHSTPESHVCVEKCNFEEGIRDQNLMFASKSTIISFLRRKMQFRNRHSRPESHVRIEECNYEKSFDVRILFFASKNAILTKAFETRIAFLHRIVQ